MTNIWNKAEEQTRQDIKTFVDVVKPKLEQYYRLTGEDITINLNDKGQYDKPIIQYSHGNALSSSIIDTNLSLRSGYNNQCNDKVKYIDLKYGEVYNIELVRECLDHWDKIVLKLEERLNQLYKDCSIKEIQK